jgi:hypothetical protein
MPKDEPDPEDPLELAAIGVADPGGESTRLMAECLAEEFLRMGHSPGAVMDLFRSPAYSLAHRAWLELGEVRVFTLVSGVADRWRRAADALRARRGGHDA